MFSDLTPEVAQYQKRRLGLRCWLLGQRFHLALDALAVAESYHTGTRKDGITPEFAHQINIARHLCSLSLNHEDMEPLLVACFFHDAPEDKGLPVAFISTRYGDRAGGLVEKMTKEFQGRKMNFQAYCVRLSSDPLSAILKGGDRIQNLESMVGVFSLLKQQAYVEETEQYIVPMLKQAQRRFPAYDAQLQNLRMTMYRQLSLLHALHIAVVPKNEMEPSVVEEGVPSPT